MDGYNGTAPYQFSIDGINFQPLNVFNNISAGTYSVYIRDTVGYEDSTSITVHKTCFNLSVNTKNTTCNNRNGSIIISVQNGKSPYKYSINGGDFQMSNFFDSLDSGTYDVTVLDYGGISKDTTINISAIPSPRIEVSANDANCKGKDGSILISVSGEIAPFNYSIDKGITFQLDSSFRNVDSGKYFIVVKDENNCSTGDTIEINAPPLPVFSLGRDTSLCEGDTLLLSVPYNTNYKYQWQDNSELNDYKATVSGSYFLKITKILF